MNKILIELGECDGCLGFTRQFLRMIGYVFSVAKRTKKGDWIEVWSKR